MVMCLQENNLLPVLHHERSIEARRVDEHVERLFRQPQPLRRGAQHLRSEFQSLLEQRVSGSDIADEADRFGALGLEEAAREQQLRGDGKADQPGQQVA
jgi:hypothetical protein